jgi:hypothetical protein
MNGASRCNLHGSPGTSHTLSSTTMTLLDLGRSACESISRSYHLFPHSAIKSFHSFWRSSHRQSFLKRGNPRLCESKTFQPGRYESLFYDEAFHIVHCLAAIATTFPKDVSHLLIISSSSSNSLSSEKASTSPLEAKHPGTVLNIDERQPRR